MPAPRHATVFDERSIERAPSAHDTLEGKPALRRPGIVLQDGDPDVSSSDDLIRNQLHCLTAVDEGVGRILQALQASNQLDNTLIVFTSDHGYFWGEHDLGGKHGPYEESLRILFFVRYPTLVAPGTTFDQLTLSIDLAPTCLDLAGVNVPASAQGMSLLPLLAGKSRVTRDAFLAEYFYNPGQTARFPTWLAVRTERWKYITYPTEKGMDELYDLKSDHYEMQNVVEHPDSRDALASLKEELQKLLAKTDFHP
jgi:N-acetylglucosamine-6-sulfatase